MNPTVPLKVGGVLAAALSLGISAFAAVWADQKMTHDATESMQRTTSILAGQTYLAFQNIDIVLKQTSRMINYRFPTWVAVEPKRLHDVIEDSQAGLAQSQAVMLFDTDGRMSGHSRLFPVPDINVKDREYFIVHARVTPKYDIGLFISSPVKNRVNGNWMIPVSRRLDIDGRFTGVLMCALDYAYFSWIYSEIFMPDGSEIYTKRNDGTTLLSFPPGTEPPNGQEYLGFSTKVPNFDLTVGMVIPLDELRRPWRVILLTVFCGSLFSSLVILILIVYATINLEKYEHWEDLKRKVGWTPGVINGGKSDAGKS